MPTPTETKTTPITPSIGITTPVRRSIELPGLEPSPSLAEARDSLRMFLGSRDPELTVFSIHTPDGIEHTATRETLEAAIYDLEDPLQQQIIHHGVQTNASRKAVSHYLKNISIKSYERHEVKALNALLSTISGEDFSEPTGPSEPTARRRFFLNRFLTYVPRDESSRVFALQDAQGEKHTVTREEMSRAIDAIENPRDRQFIDLAFEKGMSKEEICEMLHKKPKTYERMSKRILDRLVNNILGENTTEDSKNVKPDAKAREALRNLLKTVVSSDEKTIMTMTGPEGEIYTATKADINAAIGGMHFRMRRVLQLGVEQSMPRGTVCEILKRPDGKPLSIKTFERNQKEGLMLILERAFHMTFKKEE